MLELATYITCSKSNRKHHSFNGWFNSIIIVKIDHVTRIHYRRNDYIYGVEIDFYSCGQITWLDSWYMSQRSGIDTRYDNTGQIQHIQHWRGGFRHGIEIQYSNGQIEYISNRYDGFRHGIEIQYSNGQIEYLRHWRNGSLV